MLCLFVCCWWFSYFTFWYINANHSLGGMPLVKLFKRASEQWPSQSQRGKVRLPTTTFQGCCCENFGYVYFERARSNMIPTQSTDLWPFTREFRSVIGPWAGLSCCLSFSPRANVKITSTGSIMDPVIHALATVRQCSWMIQNEYWYWLMVLVIKHCPFVQFSLSIYTIKTVCVSYIQYFCSILIKHYLCCNNHPSFIEKTCI